MSNPTSSMFPRNDGSIVEIRTMLLFSGFTHSELISWDSWSRSCSPSRFRQFYPPVQCALYLFPPKPTLQQHKPKMLRQQTILVEVLQETIQHLCISSSTASPIKTNNCNVKEALLLLLICRLSACSKRSKHFIPEMY